VVIPQIGGEFLVPDDPAGRRPSGGMRHVSPPAEIMQTIAGTTWRLGLFFIVTWTVPKSDWAEAVQGDMPNNRTAPRM